jgi:hypothetical protein
MPLLSLICSSELRVFILLSSYSWVFFAAIIAYILSELKKSVQDFKASAYQLLKVQLKRFSAPGAEPVAVLPVFQFFSAVSAGLISGAAGAAGADCSAGSVSAAGF